MPSIPDPFYKKHFQNGEVACYFSFHEIKLWELEPEVIEKPQLTMLLPLLPLMRNGRNRETVQRMMCGIIPIKEIDVVFLAWQLAKEILTSKEDQQWWQEQDRLSKERFRYLVAKEERLRQELLQIVEMRFPELLTRTKEVLERGLLIRQLEVMRDRLDRAITVEEVEAALVVDG